VQNNIIKVVVQYCELFIFVNRVIKMSSQVSSKLVATAPEFVPRFFVDNEKIEDSQCYLETDLSRKDSCLSNDSCGDDGLQNELDESLSDVERQLRAHRSTSVTSDTSEEGEGGRDSGIEGEKEPDMVEPDQDLTDRIVTQVEIYFSDSNVTKDKFLLKHIRRNKEGYVSLKLVSSFKKVKQLTKDWRVVAHALRNGSAGIQINDLGTKIRRIADLPEIDETPVTCTILALNLPLEKPTINTVSQLFGQCGDIGLIRVLKAGAPLSTEMKQLSSKYSALNETHCAWIEFDLPEAAKEACKLSSEEGMKVVPISAESSSRKNSKTSQGNKSQGNSRKNSVNNNANNSNNINGIQINHKQSMSRKNSLKNNNNRNTFEQSYYTNSYNSFGRQNTQQRRKAVSLQHSERPIIRDLTVIAENGRRRPKSKSCVEVMSGSSAHPHQQVWLQRHLFAAAVASANSAAAIAGGSGVPMIPSALAGVPTPGPLIKRPSRTSLGTLSIPEGVERFPKGPDGSKGFGFRRISKVVTTA